MSTRRLSIYPNSQSFEENLTELQRNLTALTKYLNTFEDINTNLLAFNRNFSVFLQGLRLNSECLNFPEEPNADSYTLAERPVTPPSPIPEPEIFDSKGTHPYNDSDKAYDGYGDHPTAIPRPKVETGIRGGVPKKHVMIKTKRRRRPVFHTRKITDLLSQRYKEQPHRGIIELILKELHANRDGLYVHEIVKDVGGSLTRSKCIEYMNALVRTDFVVRINKKGHLFLLDSEKIPK